MKFLSSRCFLIESDAGSNQGAIWMPHFRNLSSSSEEGNANLSSRRSRGGQIVCAAKACARVVENTILFCIFKPEYKGAYVYLMRPKRRGQMAEAFNGQIGRQKIFNDIVKAVDIKKIIETGTYMGLTTSYMNHQSGLPVVTAEANAQYFGYARRRFKNNPSIVGHFSDSRSFLRHILSENNTPESTLFFYLDAHWYNDLPLREEIEIIFDLHPNSIILIDDFQVPDDPGYTYDDYGNGNKLHLEYLYPIMSIGFRTFFPSLPSDQETGAKRGCVVLVKDENLIEAISSLNVLREYNYV